MDLSYVQALLVGETRQKMASLATLAPIVSKASTLRDLSRLFQAVGICHLLVNASPGRFRENLLRSAQARRYYLRHAAIEGAKNDRFLGLSRVEAIFDALVAGSAELVNDIVALSVSEWHRGWEYEDDFCYYLFVHRLLTKRGFLLSAECGELLQRFERVLEAKPSPRLDLCLALRAGEAQALRRALETFLDQRKSALDKRRATLTEYTAQAIFWPPSFVCVEALGWLTVARTGGITFDDEFLFCPREALATHALPEVEDFFESLDKALAGSRA